jgi:membrane protease YdiL (CAAX protease family)
MQTDGNHEVEAAAAEHSISVSVALHLLPGLVITAIYIAVAPMATRNGIPLFLVMLVLVLLFLIPFELGWVLYEGRKRNGYLSLEGIVTYRQRMSVKQFIVLAMVLLAWILISAAILFRPVERPIIEKFFFWVPSIYFFEDFVQRLDEYDRTTLVITALMGVFLNGLVGPIVEEMYFRGYLLPRIPRRAGAWAPLLNSCLFSLYHFFTPWQIPLRILAFTPLFYVVWWKRNIYLAMFVHCGANLGGMITMAVLILRA